MLAVPPVLAEGAEGIFIGGPHGNTDRATQGVRADLPISGIKRKPDGKRKDKSAVRTKGAKKAKTPITVKIPVKAKPPTAGDFSLDDVIELYPERAEPARGAAKSKKVRHENSSALKGKAPVVVPSPEPPRKKAQAVTRMANQKSASTMGLYHMGTDPGAVAGSFWDISDSRAPYDALRPAIVPRDMDQLEFLSSPDLDREACANLGRGIQMIHTLRRRSVRYGERAQTLEAELAHSQKQLAEFKSAQKAESKLQKRYDSEVASGSSFLSSPAGEALLRQNAEEAVEAFRRSDAYIAECRKVALEKSRTTYAETVVSCRRALRDHPDYGSKDDDFLWLHSRVPDPEEDVMDEDVDGESEGEGSATADEESADDGEE